MGIVDDLKAVLEDQGPPMSLMTFVKGEDVHNVVYQVHSYSFPHRGTSLRCDEQYPSDKRTDQGFGVHRCVHISYLISRTVSYHGPHSGLFLKALERLLPPSVGQHFNKRCTSTVTAPDGRVRISFADGTEHTADVVIGADGVKSAVRAQSA